MIGADPTDWRMIKISSEQYQARIGTANNSAMDPWFLPHATGKGLLQYLPPLSPSGDERHFKRLSAQVTNETECYVHRTTRNSNDEVETLYVPPPA